MLAVGRNAVLHEDKTPQYLKVLFGSLPVVKRSDKRKLALGYAGNGWTDRRSIISRRDRRVKTGALINRYAVTQGTWLETFPKGRFHFVPR